MTELTLVFDPTENGPDAERVRNGVIYYNFAATGVSAYYPANYYLKTGRGELMGGLLGMIWGGCLHISFLWVDEAVRGQNQATRLQQEVQLENPAVSLEETMVAIQKAQIGFQATLHVRNRMVQAYTDIMNMQV